MVRYFLNLTGDKVNNPHQVSVIRQYAQILFNSIVHDKVFLLPLWMPIMKVVYYFFNYSAYVKNCFFYFRLYVIYPNHLVVLIVGN